MIHKHGHNCGFGQQSDPEVEFVGMNHIGAFLFGKSVDYDPRTA